MLKMSAVNEEGVQSNPVVAHLASVIAAGLAGPTDETAQVLKMSALNEEGVMAVRSAACDRLLASRVDLKLKVQSSKRCNERSIGLHDGVALRRLRPAVGLPRRPEAAGALLELSSRVQQSLKLPESWLDAAAATPDDGPQDLLACRRSD